MHDHAAASDMQVVKVRDGAGYRSGRFEIAAGGPWPLTEEAKKAYKEKVRAAIDEVERAAAQA